MSIFKFFVDCLLWERVCKVFQFEFRNGPSIKPPTLYSSRNLNSSLCFYLKISDTLPISEVWDELFDSVWVWDFWGYSKINFSNPLIDAICNLNSIIFIFCEVRARTGLKWKVTIFYFLLWYPRIFKCPKTGLKIICRSFHFT